MRRTSRVAAAVAAYAVALFVAAVSHSPSALAADNMDTGLDDGEMFVPLTSFSLQAPFVDFTLSNKYWNFGGDAVVHVDNMIRLTADRPSQKGWLWGKQMLTSTAWMVEFEFKVGSDNNNYADGFAFWYTLESEKEGPVFGSTDKFNGLGLFFDTYSNGRHDHDFPYVASMIGDGLTTYDLDRDGKTHSIGGCQSSFRRMDWPTRARVKYVRGSLLEVHLNVRASNQWEECFSVANVTLPTMGHIGFSAHTGDLTDNHDIISVIVNGIVNPKAQKILPSANTATRSTERPEKQKPSKPAKGGSFSVTGILIFLLVLGAVGGGLYYYSNHVRRPPKAYKRF